jgi:hypothetical protein
MSFVNRLSAMSLAMLIAGASPSLAAERDWSAVGKALGKEGTIMPGGIYRIALPRTDLSVTLDGVTLKPGFALGGWLAFAPMGDKAMVMGDLVMTQEEINPVVKRFEESGIEITALHNHLLRAEPATMYMHVKGEGDPEALRENGIEVTALHNHMLDDQPRLFFMHFWANDDAEKLAKGLRAALDHVATGKS